MNVTEKKKRKKKKNTAFIKRTCDVIKKIIETRKMEIHPGRDRKIGKC